MKPIRLTEELVQKMAAEFVEKLRSTNFADGKVSYSRSFVWKDNSTKINVLFKPEAYAKMLLLIHAYNCEVAWHGVVDRPTGDTFIIRDILVYPQEVTGVTVDTDQDEYQQWLMHMDDDVFNALRMQGHSHVEMGVTPSAVDLEHQGAILSQLNGESFYIFMIYNKKLNYTIKVYDMKSNTLYENDDVVVGIDSETGDLESFLSSAEKLVVRKTTTVSKGAGNAKKNHKDPAPDYGTVPYGWKSFYGYDE